MLSDGFNSPKASLCTLTVYVWLSSNFLTPVIVSSKVIVEMGTLLFCEHVIKFKAIPIQTQTNTSELDMRNLTPGMEIFRLAVCTKRKAKSIPRRYFEKYFNYRRPPSLHPFALAHHFSLSVWGVTFMMISNSCYSVHLLPNPTTVLDVKHGVTNRAMIHGVSRFFVKHNAKGHRWQYHQH